MRMEFCGWREGGGSSSRWSATPSSQHIERGAARLPVSHHRCSLSDEVRVCLSSFVEVGGANDRRQPRRRASMPPPSSTLRRERSHASSSRRRKKSTGRAVWGGAG